MHVADMTLKQLHEHCIKSRCGECVYVDWCGGNPPCEWKLPVKKDDKICPKCGDNYLWCRCY